jgi:glycerol-3-phosphate dehydrogenase (NAD(P)+)
VRQGPVAVVGAGSWGTAIAALLGGAGGVRLWARTPEVAERITERHENPAYLPGVALPPRLTASSSLPEVVAGSSVVLVAVPSHGFRAVAAELPAWLTPGTPIVSLAKGLEIGTNLRMSEVLHQVAPGFPAGVLTGPNLAREVAEGQPAASVVALRDETEAAAVQDLLHSRRFRVYRATDVVGCEIAGAAKNVMAIAAGISDGIGFGENTRAFLITRALAELGRLGIAMGGHTLTFGGLAGVGDLVATCASTSSRNHTVGFELGRGRPLAEILAGMRMVAEGVKTAGPLVGLARSLGVEMPIADQVERIVSGRCAPREALSALMDRPPRAEWDEAVRQGLHR